MNDRILTKQRAEALAEFIHTLRPDWQTPGIVAALAKSRHDGDAYENGTWAIRAAAEPANRTPAIIGMDGKHRRPLTNDDDQRTITPDSTYHVADMRCPHCGLWVVRGEDHECGRRADPDRTRDALAAAKAAIAKPEFIEPPAQTDDEGDDA